MLELIVMIFWTSLDVGSAILTNCWIDWTQEWKPYRFCYLGLAGLYFAARCGARHDTLYSAGAVVYLALYLLQ